MVYFWSEVYFIGFSLSLFNVSFCFYINNFICKCFKQKHVDMLNIINKNKTEVYAYFCVLQSVTLLEWHLSI